MKKKSFTFLGALLLALALELAMVSCASSPNSGGSQAGNMAGTTWVCSMGGSESISYKFEDLTYKVIPSGAMELIFLQGKLEGGFDLAAGGTYSVSGQNVILYPTDGYYFAKKNNRGVALAAESVVITPVNNSFVLGEFTYNKRK